MLRNNQCATKMIGHQKIQSRTFMIDKRLWVKIYDNNFYYNLLRKTMIKDP